MRFVRGVARRVTLPRALFEASIIVVAWCALIRTVEGRGPDQTLAALVSLVSSAVAVAALRLRRFPVSRRGVVAELVCAAIASLWVGLLQYLYIVFQFGSHYLPISHAVGVFTVLNGAVYVVTRFVVVGIPWWLRFQRRQLRWQLVHLQLLVVVLLGLIPLTLLAATILREQASSLLWGNGPVSNAVIHLASAIAFALAVTTVFLAFGMAIVLPPTILVSYLAAKRTTRRLEDLAGTAAALRDGRLDARVTVEGVDEVAQLQADVNTMASTLQQSVAELSAQRDTVQQLLEQRQELVASVSHELKTPVAIMRGYLDSALEGETEIPQQLRHDLQVMHGESVRLQRLIEDLFVLSRASVAQLPLRVEAVDVRAVLQQCVHATAPSAWQSGRVEVLLEPGPAVPPIAVDPDRLMQILMNVVTNGVRHSPPGGLVLLSAQHEDRRVAVRVADTGDGIPPAELEQIWERFYRGSNARDPRGSGLGLALAKELTEAMGGDVSVHSIPCEETVFTFRFPVAP
jgi:signal transduction histidine kinase